MTGGSRESSPGAALAAAGLAAVLAGCARPAPPTAVSLLHRAPDGVLDQPGTVAPARPDTWSRCALLGWETAWRDRPEEPPPRVWTHQPRAVLDLPAGRPADRTIELVVRGGREPRGREPVHLTLELNGHPLGRHALSAETRTIGVAAPASAWRRGENLLALEVDRMHDGPTSVRGLALERAAYGPPVRAAIEPERGRARLPAEAGLRYLVERVSPGALAWAVEAEGRGTLLLELGFLDPRTGAVVTVPADRVALELSGGAAQGRRALPPVGPGPLSLDLTWLPRDPQSDLTLTRLEVLGAHAPERPPIVFLSIDTLAARSMSLYGYGRETTPELAAWAAEEAVDFTRCKANAPWTVPSYLSQFTGLYPDANRITRGQRRASDAVEGHRVPPWELDQLAPNRWTLAELARAAGYRTGAIVDNTFLARIAGVEQGFDHFDDEPSRISIDDPEGGMRLVFPRALEWLAAAPDGRPPFLFLQILDCHAPYRPTGSFRDAFAGDGFRENGAAAPLVDYVLPPTFGTISRNVARSVVGPEEPLPEELPTGRLVRAYDEQVREVDAAVGDFLERLAELPLYDEAVVVVTADHGESMVEHGHLFRHGILTEETLHVPLLVKLPHGRGAGRRIDRPVQLVDLYATLADLAGADPERDLHGESLVPLLEGEEREPRPVVGQGNVFFQSSIELDGWKLVRYRPKAHPRTLLSHPELSHELAPRFFDLEAGPALTRRLASEERARTFEAEHADRIAALLAAEDRETPRVELFDLRRDPGEQSDVSAEHPGVVERLSALLDRETGRATSARQLASFSPRSVELSDEQLAELRRLGYWDD